MAKLSTYTNNLFATHAHLDNALSYAQDVANGSDNPAAVMTAVHAVLNTAISMHRAELAAFNKPLIELIDARVAAALTELKGSLEDMETNLESKITEAIDDMDIEDKISEAIANYGIEGKISEAVEELDIDSQIQGWYDSNFDIESALSGTSISINFD